MRLRTYFIIADVKIENPDIVIAFLVEKIKKDIHIGVTMPPPPIPAAVDRAIRNDKTSKP